MNHTFTYALRRAQIQGIISRALVEPIIPLINALRRANVLSYLTIVVTILSSYFLSQVLGLGTTISHFALVSLIVTPVLYNHFEDLNKNGCGEGPRWKDYVEDLGGDGPKVAAYLRRSTKKEKSFSLDAQRDALNKLKIEFKPSKIFWHIDDGKSSKSPEDFDKLKINDIQRLRERKEIQELWVFSVDRMGRVCRKLLFFFLEFCDDGGTIRTPDKAYNMKDLASIVTFLLEAHTAENANKNRRNAMMAGKSRAFRQKRWNKRFVPLGYRREGTWLRKLPEYESLIKEIYRLFLLEKCLESVRKKLGNFPELLTKPLTCIQIRRILFDPVYAGMPEHMGEVVIDVDLAFVDETTYRKSLEILAKIQERSKPKRLGPYEKLAITEPITFLQSLTIFEWHHRGSCGGLIWKNGTTRDEGPEQQLFQCKKCKKFWRLPPIKTDQSKRQEGNSMNFMGGLNFDRQWPLTRKKYPRKANDPSSEPMGQQLPKSEEHSPSTNGQITGVDLMGHPVNDCPTGVKRKKLKQNKREKNQQVSKTEHDFGQFLGQANNADIK